MTNVNKLIAKIFGHDLILMTSNSTSNESLLAVERSIENASTNRTAASIKPSADWLSCKVAKALVPFENSFILADLRQKQVLKAHTKLNNGSHILMNAEHTWHAQRIPRQRDLHSLQCHDSSKPSWWLWHWREL